MRTIGLCCSLLFLVMLYIPGNDADAQIPGIRKYTQLDGYTASKGYEINQDEKGYIWLGTDNGGMRFDGNTFSIAQDTKNSADAEILNCRPVGAGRVLLLPLANEISYWQKGKWVFAGKDTLLQKIDMERNHCRLDPITGIWWLSNGNKLDKLVSFKNHNISFHTVAPADFEYAHVINQYFIGEFAKKKKISYLGVYDFNHKVYQYLSDSLGNKIKNELILDAGADKRSVVSYAWVDKLVKIYLFTPGKTTLKLLKSIELFNTNSMQIPGILIDRNNGLWIKKFEEKGVFYYGNIAGIKKEQKPRHFLESNVINSVFVDQRNNIWFSSPDNALYFLSEKHFKNALLSPQFQSREIPQSLSGNGNGTLYIGYYNNNIVSVKNGITHRKTLPNSYLVEGSRKILPMSNNRFVVFNRGIAVIDGATLNAQYLKTDDLYKDACLYKDKIFAATLSGAYIIDPATAQQTKIYTGRATAISVLTGGTILIGTPRGLYIKKAGDTGTSKITHVQLRENNITDILATDDNTALVSTNTHGLFFVSHAGNKVISVKMPPGMAFNNIKSLYRQDAKTYWGVTDKGAFYITFDNNWLVTGHHSYSFYDGLPSNNVADVYVDHDTAYFATAQGLGIIPLIRDTAVPGAAPRIYIDKLQVDSITFNEPDSFIYLRNNQNNLQFSLSAISFESLGKIQYHYQLSPVQNNWQQTTNPDLFFTQLPPGDYQLTAYVTSATGINSKPVRLLIRIQPAFWQTIYFKAFLFLLIATAFFFIFRRILRRGEKRRTEVLQQKKRLAELELEAIKAQINPHFIYNCLNSVKYLNYTGAYELTEVYLSIFAKLIRITMKHSRKAFITLDEEVDYLSNYLQLEKLRFKDKLQYIIEVEKDLGKDTLIPAMLLQPYVENALKHGIAKRKEGGKIYVQFRSRKDLVEISIKDNGPGFSSFETTDTLGLHLSTTRATTYNELFNTSIQVHYKNNSNHEHEETGALVKITFKNITNEHKNDQRRHY
jgi:ligand-binding sensor domain-containing protein